ncbi:MAG: LysM peptidoglycan-binding domain-containing protein [Psychrosphaera sp.]|nr:LysM peptidoglycan-binding domain-containing protein [Psychrosphaera sp.]
MTIHIVQPGETLAMIAKKYLGEFSLYSVIAEANNISDPDKISCGTELTIPDLQVATTDAEQFTTVAAVFPDAPKAMLKQDQLQQILNTNDDQRVDRYLDGLNSSFDRYQINTPLRIAHFLAQVCHESNNFSVVSENLNYSAQALSGLFGKYFNEISTDDYARNPQRIANRVYANRMGNGNEASGEGWKYRGRGLIQLTGKQNYSDFSAAYGVDLVGEPDQVSDNAELCIAVAGWYWDTRKLNQYADNDDIKAITKRINGGYHGLADREEKLQNIKAVLVG